MKLNIWISWFTSYRILLLNDHNTILFYCLFSLNVLLFLSFRWFVTLISQSQHSCFPLQSEPEVKNVASLGLTLQCNEIYSTTWQVCSFQCWLTSLICSLLGKLLHCIDWPTVHNVFSTQHKQSYFEANGATPVCPRLVLHQEGSWSILDEEKVRTT